MTDEKIAMVKNLAKKSDIYERLARAIGKELKISFCDVYRDVTAPALGIFMWLNLVDGLLPTYVPRFRKKCCNHYLFSHKKCSFSLLSGIFLYNTVNSMEDIYIYL